MPLRDHFTPPLEDSPQWQSLLSSWAVHLEARLNQLWVPEEFVAVNAIKLGDEPEGPLKSYDLPSLGRAPGVDEPPSQPTRQVPPPRFTVPRTKGDHVEVRVRDEAQRLNLAAVVAFVTPTNKETLQQRRGFLSRCVAHLHQGASLVLIDVVTRFPFCLYDDLLALLGAEDVPRLPLETRLFAAAFRPVSRGDRRKVIDPNERLEMDVWVEPVRIGHPLPTLPLRLIYDLFVPVEFEATYTETCRRRRVP